MSSTTPIEREPLSWGQRSVWLDHENSPIHDRHQHNVFMRRVLPGAFDARSTLDLVRAVVSSHQTLRTLMQLSPSSGPVQHVLTMAEVDERALLHHTIDKFDPDQPPDATRPTGFWRLLEHNFDLSAELPFLSHAVTDGERWTISFVLHHIAVDRVSLGVLKRQVDSLAAEFERSGTWRSPSDDLAVVEQAHRERTRRNADIAGQARRRWEHTASSCPATNFPWVPRFVHAGASRDVTSLTLRSRTMAKRVGMISRELRVFPAAVHLGAVSLVLSALSGAPAVALKTLVANRIGSFERDAVSCRFLPAPVLVETPSQSTFGSVIAQADRELMAAARTGYAPFDEGLETVTRVSHARGRPVDLQVVFNYSRMASARNELRPGDAERIVENPLPPGNADEKMMVQVDDFGGHLDVTCTTRVDVLDRTECEQILHALASVVTLLGDDPTSTVASVGARATATLHSIAARRMPPDAGWMPLGNGWANTVNVRDALLRLSSVRSAVVRGASVPGGGQSITVDVSTADPLVSSETVRTHLRAAMYTVPGIALPDEIRVVHDTTTGSSSSARSAPPDGAAPNWAERDQNRERKGLDCADPDSAVVVHRELNARLPPGFSLDDCWVTAGGRYLDIPKFRSALADLGWVAPPVHVVGSAVPLTAIIEMCERVT